MLLFESGWPSGAYIYGLLLPGFFDPVYMYRQHHLTKEPFCKEWGGSNLIITCLLATHTDFNPIHIYWCAPQSMNGRFLFISRVRDTFGGR